MRALNRYQDQAELNGFISYIREKGIKRYLEIGSRQGDSFYAVMAAIGPGGYGLSIDLPGCDAFQDQLEDTVEELLSYGIACELFLGNSQSSEAIALAKSRAPFDLILIDGDHRYFGVRSDFDNYSGLGKIIALHDIAAPVGWLADGYPCDVPQLWDKILNSGYKHRHTFVSEGSKMGYGILENA